MLEQLKRIAMQKLAQKMAGNSLNTEATGSAAQEGAGALISALTSKLGAGNLDQVKDLFSNGGQSLEENGIFQDVQGKLQQILQSKGMNAEEAMAEAKNTAPDVINSLKEKFTSSASEDSAFDVESISKWVGGDAGSMINKVKDLF